MKKINPVLALFFSIPVIIFCLFILLPDNAKWLKFQSPSYAVQGTPFISTVNLIKQVPGHYLGVDLHHMNAEKTSYGYLSGSKPVLVSAEKTSYVFSIPVTHVKNTAYIFAVIYISKDGKWDNRISAARTELLPLLSPGNKIPPLEVTIHRTMSIPMKIQNSEPESLTASIAISFIWLVVSFTAFFIRNRFQTGIVSAAAFLSSAWEAAGCSTLISKALRNIAWSSGIYNYRFAPQKIITAVIILAVAAVLIYLLLSGKKLIKNIPWISLSLFWFIAILQIISLHKTDSLLSITVSGIQTGQILKLIASFLCFSAVIYMPVLSNYRKINR